MRAVQRAFAFAPAAVFLGSLGLGAVPLAHAAEPGPDTLPIHVIAVMTPDADDQAEALTKALRSAVRVTPGWSLGAGDFSFEVLALSLKCPEPPDANCQARIADQIKTDRYVWGTLQRKDKSGAMVKGQLNFWVRGKGTATHKLEYTSNLTEGNDETLKKLALDAMNQLTGGPPKGGVHVKAGRVNGQVFIDGQPIGALKEGDGTYLVPSGQHKVTVKAIGYADAEANVTVKPTGAASEISFSLIPVKEKTVINGRLIGGAVSLGVGVASGIVGLVSSLQVNSAVNDKIYADYRKNTPVGQDACENAQPGGSAPNSGVAKTCSTGNLFNTLQIPMYVIAAVGGGVGIFLLATAGKSRKVQTTGWTFEPFVSPQSGFVNFKYTF